MKDMYTYGKTDYNEEWHGEVYLCNECGFYFMLNRDLDTCYCPQCGKHLTKRDDTNVK